MKEVVDKGEALRKIVVVIIRFATQNLNIYTVQDVMHSIQLATYWLNMGVSSFYVGQESDISQDALKPDEMFTSTDYNSLPTGSPEQLDFILKELAAVCKVIEETLEKIPMDQKTKYNLTNGLTRLTEAQFNTRMTIIAYEGLQNLGRNLTQPPPGV